MRKTPRKKTASKPQTVSDSGANLQEFHFSTGVKPYSHVPAVPVGKHEFVDGNGVKIIRFYCEDVPQGAQFQFASPYPNCKEAAYEHWIVREIVDGGLASKYAYFYLPTL